jgi:putrescine transport system ATP-binding protein
MSCPGAGASIAVDQATDARPGDAAWFAIRPEKVAISLDPPADRSVNTVSGEVWDIGYLGDVSVYHVRVAGGGTIKATVANRTRLVERPITWDDQVHLSWTSDAGMVLTS